MMIVSTDGILYPTPKLNPIRKRLAQGERLMDSLID
jgi:hypothetical protein